MAKYMHFCLVVFAKGRNEVGKCFARMRRMQHLSDGGEYVSPTKGTFFSPLEVWQIQFLLELNRPWLPRRETVRG